MSGEDRKGYHKQYYKDHREQSKARSKQWKKNNRKYFNRYMQQWKKDNPEKVIEIRIKFKYNLSYEDWLKIWEGQDGRCAICSKPFVELSSAYVDHNHKTGEVRGLLCKQCNSGIGYLKDDPKLTARATEYLLGDK